MDSSTLFTGYAWGFGSGGVAFHPTEPDRFIFFCFDAGPVWTGSRGDWFERRSAPGAWHSRGRISWTGAYRGEYQPVAGSRTIVATIGYYHDAKLMRSTDDGRTWELVEEANGNYYFVGFHPRDPNLVFCEDLSSRDAGATWQAIPFLRDNKAEIMGIAASRPDTLYALAKGGREIFRSDDRGGSWRSYVKADWRFAGLSSLPTFGVDGRDANVVYTLGRDRDLARFVGGPSIAGGESAGAGGPPGGSGGGSSGGGTQSGGIGEWRSMGVLKLAGAGSAEDEKISRQTQNYVDQVAFDPRRPEILYATTGTAGLPYVFRSRDGGATWEDISRNLPRLGRGGIVVSPHTGELLHGSIFGTWVNPPPYDSPKAIYHKLVVPK